MRDIPIDLGRRIVEAARLAALLHANSAKPPLDGVELATRAAAMQAAKEAK